MLKTASSFANSIGALNYKGTWNASTNTPTLVSGVGTKGDYYVVSVAGTTNLDGTTLWGVGDLAAFNGSIWQKIDGGDTGLFTSITVAGLTGYMYANNNTPVTASTTIPVASVTGAVPNTVNVLASGLLTGGGALTGNVTVGLTSVPVANVPGAVPNTVNVLTSGLLSGGGALTGNVTVSLTNIPFANVTGAGTMASQNANAVVITGGTVDNVVIGGTTPNAATVTTLTANSTAQFGRASANYVQIVGSNTGNAVVFSMLGSDGNVSAVFLPKGAGAIDLAAGSSGVNISNGGTVTAVTRTATNTDYTSKPTMVISAPTTAGGVQAVYTIDRMFTSSATVSAGGTGYTVGDTLTIVGGTPTTSAVNFVVQTVSAGVVTAVSGGTLGGSYNTLPTNPVSVTGGTGTGATFNIFYGTGPAFTVSNAGSGYVEQPTVTFSGGGGSGAAAYASVGATATIKGLYGGSSVVPLQFSGPSGALLQIMESGNTSSPSALIIKGSNGLNQIYPNGSNATLSFSSNGTGPISFYTNTLGAQQFNISHTASAVNYVQVTGGASGSPGVVTLSAQGSSTDVDIAITPRGAGVIKFGTYTVSALLAVAGYITIKDSGGTTRRLLVG